MSVGDWKVLKGTNYKGAWDGWYGPAGNRKPSSYNVNQLYQSLAGRAVAALKLMPTTGEIFQLRKSSETDCTAKLPYLKKGTSCDPLNAPCLFNIKDDPCERYNLAEK